MRHITFKELLEIITKQIFSDYKEYSNAIFYWKDGDNQYHEIIGLDLIRGRLDTDNGDFSEFEWEMEESRIYMEDSLND